VWDTALVVDGRFVAANFAATRLEAEEAAKEAAASAAAPL